MTFTPSTIRNIIFDLGGVILNINPQLTTQAFLALAKPELKIGFDDLRKLPVFDEYERGAISDQEFRDTVQKIFSISVSNSVFDRAWNALLLDLPLARIELLKAIRPNYRLFLLSNTNAIHRNFFNALINRMFNIDGLEPLFEKTYYSYEMEMIKPDTKIFEAVVQENGLSPAETLFIDDAAPNIIGAQKAGLQTVHLHQMDITQLFLNGKLK